MFDRYLQINGARLKEYRKSKEYTQKDVAEALGISIGTVSLWERLAEKTDFTLSTVSKILKAYPDILNSGEENPSNKTRTASQKSTLDNITRPDQVNNKVIAAFLETISSEEVKALAKITNLSDYTADDAVIPETVKMSIINMLKKRRESLAQ